MEEKRSLDHRGENNVQRRRIRDAVWTKESVVLNDQRSKNYFYEEAIKTLRTNVQFAGADIHSILVTSCFPDEGKSDIVFQLATEMGKAGKKVLLLDADIRRSVYTRRYQVEKQVKGLSQYLSGQVGWKEILYQTNCKGVDMVFAGPSAPNPSELLEEELFAHFMEGMRERYDYVLVDTPPMMSVIDAAIVARFCDASILIVESGLVGYRTAQKVKTQLEKSGCRILGAVLNKVDPRRDKYYASYYRKYGEYEYK